MGYLELLKQEPRNQALFVPNEQLHTFNIVTEQARYPLRNLVDIFREHDLDPRYQRGNVWDQARKSKLIESFIINIPVPPIFLYEKESATYEVMDGKQRLTAILDFYSDQFELKGLDIWDSLNGKKYSELDKETKGLIDRRYISATILLRESARDASEQSQLKQIVFERLNTGGLSLTPQETRNALYTSSFIEMLFEIAKTDTFQKLLPFKKNQIDRMEDCEFILRYFAYKSALHNEVFSGTKVILDTFAERARELDSDTIRDMYDEYTKSLQFLDELFGEKSFTSKPGRVAPEKMIYDALMISASYLLRSSFDFETTKNMEKNNEMKYLFIEEHKKNFNGKYTAMSVVSERVNLFENAFWGTNEHHSR